MWSTLAQGSGIQGIAAALAGASHVTLTDVSASARDNSLININAHGLSDRCNAFQGDLFEKVNLQADVVIFAQPYFEGDPIPEIPVTLGMLNDGDLVQRFFHNVKAHLKDDGIILMPFLDIAGDTNNPQVQAPKHGFRVEEIYSSEIADELQSGEFHIYSLK